MANSFQRAYKITFGQFNTSDSFNIITEITELRCVANISVNAKDGTIITPEVSTVKIYNMSPDIIRLITGADDLYVEIRAGYRYSEGNIISDDDLPVVYFGSVVFINTSNKSGLDLITTFYCTPMHSKSSSAKANRTFTKGTPVVEIFNYLANTMNSTIVHDWLEKDSLILKKDKTLTGSSSKLMHDWAERYNLRACHESSSIVRIIDKSVRDTGKATHIIPLTNIKGYPEISLDVTKVLKEKTTKTPDVSLSTFLFPQVEINEIIRVELIDYTSPQILGKYQTTFQDFIVTNYNHKLDSHENGSGAWTTNISGKGAQQ